jgi:hypothetical protein
MKLSFFSGTLPEPHATTPASNRARGARAASAVMSRSLGDLIDTSGKVG